MTDYVMSLVNPNRRVVRVDADKPVSFKLTRAGVLRALGNAADPKAGAAGHPLNGGTCIEAVECKAQLGADAVAVAQTVARIEHNGVQTRYQIRGLAKRINEAYDKVTAPTGVIAEEERDTAMAFLVANIGKEVVFSPYTFAKSHAKVAVVPQGATPQRGGRPKPAIWRRNGSGQSRLVGSL